MVAAIKFTAAERLRVAGALEGLPAMEAALDSGELSYSAVRELTRIATCKTEEAWLDACRGKVLREIEEMVREREPGDGPDARPKPDLRPKRISLDLRPAVVARMRQAHATLDAVRGERNDYNDLLDEAFRCLIAMHAGSDATDDAAGNTARARAARSAPTQIATVTKCEACGQAWQIGAGRKIALTPAELETAECDAVHIGSLEGPPQRASSTIPPRTRKRVLQRDNYKCTVPWCRAAANIDVHHLRHRKHGGGHQMENMTSLCGGHHHAHHRGELLIEGRAPALTFRLRNEVPHVGELSRVINLVPHVGEPHSPHSGDALLALTALGFTKHEATTALAAALAVVPPDAGLDPLLRAALRYASCADRLNSTKFSLHEARARARGAADPVGGRAVPRA